MSRRATYTQAEILRALKAAKAAGFQVAGFKATTTGVEVIFGEPGKAKRSSSLDRFLDEAPETA